MGTFARLLSVFALLFLGATAGAAERPNILFIMSDDHAAHAVGCYGSQLNETPNIDRIAEEGIRYTNCFCTNSLCGPSRAVVLTGKYSHKNGFYRNGNTFNGTQQTSPKLLRKAGYTTAIFGKWHLGSTPTGFDHYEVLIGQGPYFNPPLKTAAGVVQHRGYTTDIITDRTLDWLKTRRPTDRPFFVMCHHKAPHANWEADAKHSRMYEHDLPEPATFNDDYATRSRAIADHSLHMQDCYDRHFRRLKGPAPKGMAPEEYRRWSYQVFIKDYLRVIASVDDNVGRLLDYLDESGLAKNTIVIYTSDQGFFLGDHNLYDKRLMYEHSLRMPLVARWPGTIEAGQTSDALVMNLDFTPTFLGLAETNIPADVQGKSLVSLLAGETPVDWRDAIYYRFYEKAYGIPAMLGVRTARHKLIHYQLDGCAPELFDLHQDPDELRNVYEDKAYLSVRASLTKKLRDLQTHYEDQ
ncbi:MAG: sulfatase [Planctomycetota bacterium]